MSRVPSPHTALCTAPAGSTLLSRELVLAPWADFGQPALLRCPPVTHRRKLCKRGQTTHGRDRSTSGTVGRESSEAPSHQGTGGVVACALCGCGYCVGVPQCCVPPWLWPPRVPWWSRLSQALPSGSSAMHGQGGTQQFLPSGNAFPLLALPQSYLGCFISFSMDILQSASQCPQSMCLMSPSECCRAPRSDVGRVEAAVLSRLPAYERTTGPPGWASRSRVLHFPTCAS